MPHLEPTYLRYIYDGLVKGSIHPENAAELPEGLIGLYEEAFDERTSVIERQKLLQRFAIWALLKKEVSAAFVAEVLGETEDEMQDFISTYSAWFNSPESGKYQLYHERLKVYLLQKLSETHLHKLNSMLIEFLERNNDSENEKHRYKLEYLIVHSVLDVFFKPENKRNLIEHLVDPLLIENQIKFRVDRELVFAGMSIASELSMNQNDWEILGVIAKGASEFHRNLNTQIEKDLRNHETDWNVLFEHFNSASDTEEKVRLFFLMTLENRDWSDVLFQSITEQMKVFGEEEYIDISEITPVWLLEKTKKMFTDNVNLIAFFNEADYDNIAELDKLEPNFMYVTEELNDYPKEYISDFERLITSLSTSKDLGHEDFLELYESISPSNLISKDEIACRVSIELINKSLEQKNSLNWFIWLITRSNFELGEHSWGRINTYELSVLLIKRVSLLKLQVFASNIDEIKMDYHTKNKLRNVLSDGFYAAGDKKMAKEVLIKFGNSKSENLDTSSWIRSWILKDTKNRAFAKEQTHQLDRLEISFNEFCNSTSENKNTFLESELLFQINRLDLVSKAEYLADFAVQLNDVELKEYLLLKAWHLVKKQSDWAEFFAKISVFTAALEIMPKSWNEEAFKSLKKDFTRYELEDYETHLIETIFRTEKFRFASVPPFQNLKANYPNEFKYLLREYPELCSESENEIAFKKFLINDLNNYSSMKEMWREIKKNLSASVPGELSTEFWNYIHKDTKLFMRFTVDDVRVINVISRKVNVRFPYERFMTHHPKMSRYANRFVIPDPYHLGLEEGFEAMAKFTEKLDYDHDFRTVFNAAMRGSSKRYDNRDWTKDPIQPLAYAFRKILYYQDDVNKVDSILHLRTKLTTMIKI